MKFSSKLLGVLLLTIFGLSTSHAESDAYFARMMKNVDCIIATADTFEHSHNFNSYSKEVSELTTVATVTTTLVAKLRMKDGSTELTKLHSKDSIVKSQYLGANVVPSGGPKNGPTVWEELEGRTEQSILSLVEVIGYCKK